MPHCLQSFNQIVVIAISVSQFDTEEQEFDRISRYLRCLEWPAERRRSEKRARTQLVTATTLVQRLSRCTGADFTAAGKTDGSLKGFRGVKK